MNKEISRLAAEEFKRRAASEQAELAREFEKLLKTTFREAGMKKLEDRGVSVFVQWEESSWALLPYDTKKQILQSFQTVWRNRAVVHIRGYRTGKVLAEPGIFSDTIN